MTAAGSRAVKCNYHLSTPVRSGAASASRDRNFQSSIRNINPLPRSVGRTVIFKTSMIICTLYSVIDISLMEINFAFNFRIVSFLRSSLPCSSPPPVTNPLKCRFMIEELKNTLANSSYFLIRLIQIFSNNSRRE